MNLTRCPKEFDKHERSWWRFYLDVVTSRGLMTAGKYSTLKDLCSVESQIQYNMALLRESNYGATYQDAKYVDSSGLEHTKLTVSPVSRKLDDQMKLKNMLKKSLGLLDVPAESEKKKGFEGMLDG